MNEWMNDEELFLDRERMTDADDPEPFGIRGEAWLIIAQE